MDLATLLANEQQNETNAQNQIAAGAAAQVAAARYQALLTLVQGVKALRDGTIATVTAQVAQAVSDANAQLGAPAFVGPSGSATQVEARLGKINVKDADLANVVSSTKMAAPLDTTKTVVDYRTTKANDDADLVAKKQDALVKRVAAGAARQSVDAYVAMLLDQAARATKNVADARALVADVSARLLAGDVGGAWSSMTRAQTALNAAKALAPPDTSALTKACDDWAVAEDASITADQAYADALARQATDASNLALAEAQAAAAVTAYVKSKS